MPISTEIEGALSAPWRILDEMRKPLTMLCMLIVIVTSYCTFFHNLSIPPGFYWDENYHVASAQKYLNGIFFMEQHPPLGKLLIALGEAIFDFNPADNQYISVKRAENPPEWLRFEGYRFFPALLAWLTAPLFFLLFVVLTRAPVPATFLSFLYIFDTALVTHLRGAMLDGPLMFFVVLTILFFLLVRERLLRGESPTGLTIPFGVAFACAVATKLLGLILILLTIPLAIRLMRQWRKLLTQIAVFAIAALLTWCAIWQVHFSIARTINPELNKSGYFLASDRYKQLLDEGKSASIFAFPRMFWDHMRFIPYNNKGVPRLDLCKVGENGSPFFFWPFGARSIHYHWTPIGDGAFRYLTLQVNPVIWLLGLLGVLASGGVLLLSASFLPELRLRHRELLCTFFGMYIAFMVTVSRLDRVMYLYHYFIPLIFSFILLGLCIEELRAHGMSGRRRTLILGWCGIAMLVSFAFYSPLAYSRPLTKQQISTRAIFPLWGLNCIGCPRQSSIVIPSKQKPAPDKPSTKSP